MKNAASLLVFLWVTTVFAADVINTAIITDKAVSIDVHDHQFLRIYNFTQDNNGHSISQRGAVIAAAATPTPTPTPTATPTATATPSPTPSPTATTTPSVTPTPTPTPPPRTVLTASLVDPSAKPEPIKQVVVDGPAQVTVHPVMGATLVLTYIKTTESTPTPTP
ncbi:MAG TPA: hypothetical protein VFA58_07315 [Chthoniobacterales bacterium]|nr:hypothetical protein [Chthoniobacterales bacterium]